MKLFSKEIDKRLFSQYSKGSDLDNQVVVTKIFNPYGNGRWFLLNSDPQYPDYLWAIVQMGDVVEMGSVLRSELESVLVSPYRFPLERDLSFRMVNAGELFRGLQEGKFYKKGGFVKGYSKGGFVDKTDEELKSMKDDELFEYLDAKAAYIKQYARPLSPYKAKNYAANATAVQFQNEGTSKLDENFPSLSKINEQATKDYKDYISKKSDKINVDKSTYTSDNLYYLQVLKDGEEVGREKFRAKSLKEAKEISEEEYESNYISKYGNPLNFIVSEAMEEGGEIDSEPKRLANNPNWTNEKLQAEYDSNKKDLQNLNNGFLKPSKVIGGGYKSSAIAKRLAKQYLEKNIATYKKALEIRGVMEEGGKVNKKIDVIVYGNKKLEYTNYDIDELIKDNYIFSSDNLPKWLIAVRNKGNINFPKNKQQVLSLLNQISNTNENVLIDVDIDKPAYLNKIIIGNEQMMAKGGMMADGGEMQFVTITDDEGNLIDIKLGDEVVEFKKRYTNQEKEQVGGKGRVILITGGFAKLSYGNDYEKFVALKDLKKMADGGMMANGGMMAKLSINASKTPSPKKDRIFGSSKNKIGSASSKKSASKIELNESIIKTLSEKAKNYNKDHSSKVSLSTLKAVMRRGMGAYSTSHRPFITGGAPNSRQAWGFARVNKFLLKKGGTKVKAAYIQDDDLLN